MSRLPTPGSDDGKWGDILNDFLAVSHNSDGTLKNAATQSDLSGKYTLPSGGIPETDLAQPVKDKLNTVGTVADDSITNIKVAANAAIAKSKLAPLNIADSDIASGGLTTAALSASAGIVAGQLASGVQASLTKADNALPAANLDTQTATNVNNTSSETTTALKTNYHQISSQTVTMPSGLGWNSMAFTATVQDMPGGIRSLGSVSVSPKAAFDAVSTARTSPGAEFYVDVAGSDSAAGTSGAPFASIWKAVQAANAAGVPTRIYVQAGVYDRSHNAVSGGGSNVYPTVDIALIAKNGRVITGTFDPPGTLSADATYTHTYSYTLSNAEQVHDLANLNRFGNHTELVNVSSPAICDVTPGSWVISGGKMYIHRADHAAVTSANTRVYRSASFAGVAIRNTQINFYMGGRENNSGFDLEGGTEGAISVVMQSAPSSTKSLVIENCTFKYGGGYTTTSGKSVNIETWNGLVYFSNCRADAGWTDGFNFHNTNGASSTNVLTVNCTAYDNGRGVAQTCNGWTTHDNIVGVDISGYYVNNRGGTCRSIENSKSWLAGTAVVDDLGDLAVGGTIPPTAFRVDNNAVYWLDRVRMNMPASSFGYYAYLSSSTIHLRNPWPSGLITDGGGTIDTY